MMWCWALCSAILAGVVGVAADGKVTVHLVPHTHDDTGWLKTVDQYFAGLNNTIQHVNVKMVITTVVQALAENPDRKLTYAEIAFFYRWWRQQSEAKRDVVRRLVREGQLSFTNGGWCMHDEAVPHYLDMIDQTTLGHRFLNASFGIAPKTGWQLDPFGHSSTQAALLSAEVGFVGLFFGRIDYQDAAKRLGEKAMEFVWRASPSLGDSAQVFTGLTGEYQRIYSAPAGFDWDVASNDEPIQDDPLLGDYNVKSRVDDFVSAALWQANLTRGSNVMFTMGTDFRFESAFEDFEPMDKIIKYVNQDGRVNAVYSTVEDYLAAKAKEAEVAWPLKTDDFFPIADQPHAFWTGYFTSRPAFKRYVRETSAVYQVAKQLRALSGLAPSAPSPVVADPSLEALADAMGVAQHHDALTGTEMQHVAFDYAARLATGRAAALPGSTAALATLAGLRGGEVLTVCDLRNVSVCEATRNGTGVVVLWNGLAQERNEVVELPVDVDAVHVVQVKDGADVPTQVVAALSSITNYGAPAGGTRNLALFRASVPALGFAAFRVSPSSAPAASRDVPVASDETTTIENEFLALQFDGAELRRITDKTSGVTVAANQSWLFYNSSRGEGQASGAYIFRPHTSEAFPVHEGAPTLQVVRGDVADEVHQTFGPWVSQRIRLAKGAKYAEVTYTVGPIPIDNGDGKEVVSRISTDIASAGDCFTDSNGRDMLRRRRDFRPTWTFNQTEPVAGNYYPVTTAAFIQDGKSQLTLLTDAAQAGTGCLRDGELEMMVHRRILVDDGRGVAEPLNETESVQSYAEGVRPPARRGQGLITRGRHLLTLGAPAAAAQVWRPLADGVYMPLQPFFASAGSEVSQGAYSALSQPLPSNVQIVSLEVWDESRTLLRLAHQFGLGEDAALSAPATVDLAGLFRGRTIASVDERGLAVTISRDEVLKRRIPWKVEGESNQPDERFSTSTGSAVGDDLHVTLGPLQIRTFLIQFAPAAASQQAGSTVVVV